MDAHSAIVKWHRKGVVSEFDGPGENHRGPFAAQGLRQNGKWSVLINAAAQTVPAAATRQTTIGNMTTDRTPQEDEGRVMWRPSAWIVRGVRRGDGDGDDVKCGERVRRTGCCRGENHRGPFAAQGLRQNRKWSVLTNATDSIDPVNRDMRNNDKEHDDGPHRLSPAMAARVES